MIEADVRVDVWNEIEVKSKQWNLIVERGIGQRE